MCLSHFLRMYVHICPQKDEAPAPCSMVTVAPSVEMSCGQTAREKICAFVKFAAFQEADKRKRVGVEKAQADQWLGCVKLQKTRVTMPPITL